MITNLETTSDYLQRFGIKPSLQRMAVMDYLLEHKTHPTVDEIYEALHPKIPTLSKTTVYNTLGRLADQGAVLVLNIDEKNQRFDGDIRPHAHFRCTQCERVYDVPLEIPEERFCASVQEHCVKNVSVHLTGICASCLSLSFSTIRTPIK